ncbi:MAG: N-acetylmuramoyl-L-alanine amidase [Alphaproteobacteria bacterium]
MKNIIKYSVLLAMTLMVLPALAFAVEIRVEDGKETIIIDGAGVSGHKVFTLQNPDRLVVDVPTGAVKQKIALPSDYEGTLIKNSRSGQFTPETTRIVFEIARSFSVVSKDEEKRDTLTITIAGTGAASKKKQSFETKQDSAPVRKGKPVVVIDAGHGGQDPGTIGRYKSREKDVVLQYAIALQKYLIKSGKYKVVMTREGDQFISLRGRVAIARKAKGDIFLSIHADSAPERTAKGLSVYTLSEKASDAEAEALAARENKADVIEGIDLSGEREDVADILISLAQRETNNLSSTLADMLVEHVRKKGVPLLVNTHRFAGFAVLKAPDIPSVLIETGFLSNPSEEKQLKSKAYRDKMISGIAAGIDAYFAYKKETENS